MSESANISPSEGRFGLECIREDESDHVHICVQAEKFSYIPIWVFGACTLAVLGHTLSLEASRPVLCYGREGQACCMDILFTVCTFIPRFLQYHAMNDSATGWERILCICLFHATMVLELLMMLRSGRLIAHLCHQ